MNPAVTHAVNKSIRGGHILKKRIELGDAGEPNVVSDHLTYIVPEAHSSATFEAATIYTPAEFSRRLVLNFSTGTRSNNVRRTRLHEPSGASTSICSRCTPTRGVGMQEKPVSNGSSHTAAYSRCTSARCWTLELSIVWPTRALTFTAARASRSAAQPDTTHESFMILTSLSFGWSRQKRRDP